MRSHRDADEQPSLRSTHDPEAAGRRDLPGNEILRDSDEVLVRLVPVRLKRSLMPVRAELAATAGVGNGVNTAILEPQLTHSRGVSRQLADLKTAVSI